MRGIDKGRENIMRSARNSAWYEVSLAGFRSVCCVYFVRDGATMGVIGSNSILAKNKSGDEYWVIAVGGLACKGTVVMNSEKTNRHALMFVFLFH